MGYFEKLRGYDDEVARDFALCLIPLTRTHAIVVVGALSIELTPKIIGWITKITLGVPWINEDKGNNQTANKKFFLGEEAMEDKNGVRRASLPYSWNEISYHLIKYILCEGRYNVVYGYTLGFLKN